MDKHDFQNVNIWLPDTDEGQYGFPVMKAVTEIPDVNFINSEYARRIRDKEERLKTGVMFYEWDWKFDRIWNLANRHAKWIKTYGCAIAPQFSYYYDLPKAIGIWSIYKSRWCGAYWQSLGCTVIPDVQWGEQDSFDWCFEGLPQNSILAVGQRMNRSKEHCRDLFYEGYYEMCKRLNPIMIIAYVPKKLWLPSDIPVKRISETGVNTDA